MRPELPMPGDQDPPVYSIGAVARMLDVPASTLRAWEDRYSVITPTRGECAERHTGQIVAVSAIDSADEAIRSGAAAFMRKPLEPLALVSTVRDLLGTSALVDRSREPRVQR